MAPLGSILEVQPRLEVRQNDAQLRPITLTVTRATTTFTTIVNLGGGATYVPSSQQNPSVTTTPVANPDPVIAAGSSDPSDNTGVVIGATIGALVGALLLMIFIWKCCYDYRKAAVSVLLLRTSELRTDSQSSVGVADTTTPIPRCPPLPPPRLIDVALELAGVGETTEDTL